METNVLHFFASKSPSSTISIHTSSSKSSTATKTLQTQILLRRIRPSLRVTATNSDDTTQPAPEVVGIRFKRRSKKRTREMKEAGFDNGEAAKPKAPPKKWDDMTFQEKAVELYVGEKGALFWLNKFAYASIFIIIGGWILFRFVGPALNLYQLDTPPLAPSNFCSRVSSKPS